MNFIFNKQVLSLLMSSLHLLYCPSENLCNKYNEDLHHQIETHFQKEVHYNTFVFSFSSIFYIQSFLKISNLLFS